MAHPLTPPLLQIEIVHFFYFFLEFIPKDSGNPQILPSPLNVATATIGFLALAKLDVSSGELKET